MVRFYETYSSLDYEQLTQQLQLSEFVQSQTAQIAPTEIVQAVSAQITQPSLVQATSAQMPGLLLLTTFSSHIEILNRCSNNEERIFYVGGTNPQCVLHVLAT